MMKSGRRMTMATLLLAGGAMMLAACSSTSSGPTGPSGTGTGKAAYQDTALYDGTTTPIPGAPVYVDGSPGLDGPAGNEVFTDGGGNFSVYLAENTVEPLEPLTYTVEVRDVTGTEVLWSRSVTVNPDDTIAEGEEPEVDEETSNGIGSCVSVCARLYNPSSSVERSLLEPIMEGKTNGNQFSASACSAFCKDYRGSFPGDMECNPFFLSWDGSSCSAAEEPPAEEPPAEEPGDGGGGEPA